MIYVLSRVIFPCPVKKCFTFLAVTITTKQRFRLTGASAGFAASPKPWLPVGAKPKIAPPSDSNNFLSACARCHGCKAVAECERWITRSGSAGGYFGGFRRSNGGYHGRPPPTPGGGGEGHP